MRNLGGGVKPIALRLTDSRESKRAIGGATVWSLGGAETLYPLALQGPPYGRNLGAGPSALDTRRPYED